MGIKLHQVRLIPINPKTRNPLVNFKIGGHPFRAVRSPGLSPRRSYYRLIFRAPYPVHQTEALITIKPSSVPNPSEIAPPLKGAGQEDQEMSEPDEILDGILDELPDLGNEEAAGSSTSTSSVTESQTVKRASATKVEKPAKKMKKEAPRFLIN